MGNYQGVVLIPLGKGLSLYNVIGNQAYNIKYFNVHEPTVFM